MMPEVGLFCLILAFALACVQGIIGLIPSKNTQVGIILIPATAGLFFILLTFAFIVLVDARISDDFSVANVSSHSNRALPTLYKIAGAWGNHEGSMVLWVWVLSLFGLIASSNMRHQAELKCYALGIQGFLAAGFLLFILFTSNPFARVFPPPLDGSELNPLLQDIGLVMHPPLLYLGYVGFSMTFAFAVAALLQGTLTREWATLCRPWILAAWAPLTLGIGLGGWWAYRELGWGGWWFWDPVENASLLPWLAGTALLHSNAVLQKRDGLKSWVLLLAILTFSLSLLGTFLVRSGVLTSVHSFASDPARGLFIIAYMLAISGGALLLYAIRVPKLASSTSLTLFSREGFMVINNLFLMTACATVLLGTLYPLFAEWLHSEKLTIGAPYFNATLLPLMVLPLFLAGIAPLTPWGTAKWPMLKPLLLPALTAALAAAFLVLVFAHTELALAAAGFALAAWLGVASISLLLRQKHSRSPMGVVLPVALAHLGAALLVAGITGSSLWKDESEAKLNVKESITAAGYGFVLKNVTAEERNNHTATRAEITVQDIRKHAFTTLAPEYRLYTNSGNRTSEAAIYSRPWQDIYTVIGETDTLGKTAMRVYVNPMMQFLWAGFLLMGAGGIAGLTHSLRRRHGPA